MYKRCFFLIIILLIVIVHVCHAMRPPRGDRSLVVIKIMPSEGTQPMPEIVSNAIGSLLDALKADQFKVEVVSGTQVDPRQCLEQNPTTHHVIAGLLRVEDTGIQASVYTQTTPTPKRFQTSKVSYLVAQVREYLESEEMVRLRIGMREIPENISALAQDKQYAAHIQRGLHYMLEKNDLNEAINAFEAASEVKPDSAIPHLNLALCYKRKGENEKSRQHVESGLKIDPQNRDLRNQEALLLMTEDRFKEAIIILEDLPEDDPIILWNLAYAYFQVKELGKAKEHLQKIVELDADQSIMIIAKARLTELNENKKKLQRTKSALWIALSGLGCVGASALIIVIVRRAGKQVTGSVKLKPGDALALKVQVSIALVSGLFSILTLVLTRMLNS